MPERADTPEVIDLTMFAPLLYSVGSGEEGFVSSVISCSEALASPLTQNSKTQISTIQRSVAASGAFRLNSPP